MKMHVLSGGRLRMRKSTFLPEAERSLVTQGDFRQVRCPQAKLDPDAAAIQRVFRAAEEQPAAKGAVAHAPVSAGSRSLILDTDNGLLSVNQSDPVQQKVLETLWTLRQPAAAPPPAPEKK